MLEHREAFGTPPTKIYVGELTVALLRSEMAITCRPNHKDGFVAKIGGVDIYLNPSKARRVKILNRMIRNDISFNKE